MMRREKALMTDLRRESPLASDSFQAADFELRELRKVAKVRAQLVRPRGSTTPGIDSHCFPHSPNTSIGVDPAILWKAPDDWLAYSQSLTAERLCEFVQASAADARLLITDVSSASIVLELRGARAIDVLMRDCTLDLEGNAIAAGACAQTEIAQVGVLIHRPANLNAWRIFVERSVALHVWEWLCATAAF
jgi:heterotetrameric sarcosine oxidase gamma subunit